MIPEPTPQQAQAERDREQRDQQEIARLTPIKLQAFNDTMRQDREQAERARQERDKPR